ncbi:unnamed protein product [Brassicogethes aeneus]|uniref:Uncharacterized protein n=1 Tax=Brassicogethes aeneus TaxID=1431903 RepID=A0A9P0BG48_BRAAE|nr:unnamed protein product [Brassicogethes aeneus]
MNERKKIFLRNCNAIINARPGTISVLRTQAMCNLKLVERGSRCVKDPNPISSTMSLISTKYPISVSRDKIADYEIPTSFLQDDAKGRRVEDAHIHGRILCKKEAIDWWISNSELPSKEVVKTIDIFYDLPRKEVKDYYSIKWENTRVKFGKSSIERVNNMDCKLSLQRQIRLLLDHMDTRRRVIPVIPGTIDRIATMTHATMGPSFVLTKMEIGASKSKDLETLITKFGKALINSCLKYQPSLNDIQKTIKNTKILSHRLHDLIKRNDIPDNLPTRWMKAAFGMSITTENVKGSMTTSAKPTQVIVVRESNKKGISYNIYLGKEKVRFRYKEIRGIFIHNGSYLYNISYSSILSASTDSDPTYRPELPEHANQERTLDWLRAESFHETDRDDTNLKENSYNDLEYVTLSNVELPDSQDSFSKEKSHNDTNISSDFESRTSSVISYIQPITIMRQYIESDQESLEDNPSKIVAESDDIDYSTAITLSENLPDDVLQINNINEITANKQNQNTSKNGQSTTESNNPELSLEEESAKTAFRNKLYDNYIDNAKNKQKKKRTVCKFCQISVTNFERHLCRHHKEEKKVRDYLNFPKSTKEGRQMRRNILALLRYEENFKDFVQKEDVLNSNKLPCAHCKRIIAVKYLRRHYQKCIVKPINETGQNVQHRAASQTLVACASEYANVNATLRVKNEVFSKMASDKICFLARTDPLIRHFGSYYLKKHKRAQIASACSNKMRECSRLLIEMRRRIGKPKFAFFEMLNPINFDDVVLCAKAISGYDEEKKDYKAPSLALHIGTTLQQICELTTNLLLKKSPEFLVGNVEDKLKEIKRFRFLVQSQWSNEVSSLALKDLAEKKWNKPVMLPITKDVIKLRDHILETANKNAALLKQDNNNVKAFKKLVDASLALTILFNRRRIGDVQYVNQYVNLT